MQTIPPLPENASNPGTFDGWFQEKFGRLPADHVPSTGWVDSSKTAGRTPTRTEERKIQQVLARGNPNRPKRKPKKQRERDQRQWRAERDARDARDFSRRRARHIERLQKLGVYHPDPAIIPRDVWAMSADTIADRTGARGEYYLSRCRNKIAVALIREAAFAGWRSWTSLRARRIVAAGLAEWALSKNITKLWRWGSIIRGIPLNAFAALLADPHEENAKEAVPATNTLNGTHHKGGRHENGQVGYLKALKQVRFHYYQQLPADDVGPWERIGDWAINRYWIVTSSPENIMDDKERARLMQLADDELARLEASDVDQVDDDRPPSEDGRAPDRGEDETRAPP